MSTPIIVCDQGEERSGIPQRLRDRGCAVDMRPLAAGDYLVSGAWAIERKGPRDLVDSILNRKIYRQLADISDRYEHASLLIEGDSWHGDRRLRSPLLGELYHWMSLRPNLSPIYSPSANLSALILADLARREQTGALLPSLAAPPEAPARAMRSPRDFLLALPGVGSAAARKLSDAFPDIRSLVDADQARLQQVVGPKRGATLHDLFHGPLNET